MNCSYCNTEVPPNKEICPNNECYRPIKPIPIPSGGKIRFGKYDWYVLDKQNGKSLILTEKVIEKRNYHNQEIEVTWETCDLRKYLNGEFYNSFSEADRERIIETVNENNDNPWYGASGGNATTDRIFLLSIEEVVKYFGDSGQLKTKAKNPGWDWCKNEYIPWIGDQYDIARRAVDDTGMVVCWRLRTPGANNRFCVFVFGNCGDEFDHGGINVCGGETMEDGYLIVGVGDGGLKTKKDDFITLNGVRPALWIRT